MDANVDATEQGISQYTILQLKHSDVSTVKSFLKRFQLNLHVLDDHAAIIGSFWGDSEAGLVKDGLYARLDTPLHSILHETCHYICMDSNRRKTLNKNANGTTDEENAVCYLQILLADYFPTINKQRLMQDMDNWGYSFRLGSTQAWFEHDAEDALEWLQSHHLVDGKRSPTFILRS